MHTLHATHHFTRILQAMRASWREMSCFGPCR